MKNFTVLFLTIIFIGITACKSEKEKLHDRIKDVSMTYTKSLFDSTFKIDELVITKIDTFTLKTQMILMGSLLDDKISKLYIDADKALNELKNSRRLYQLSQGYPSVKITKEMWEEDNETATKIISEIEEKKTLRDSLWKYSSTADSTTFLNYLVFFKLKYSNKSLVQKELDGEIIITKDFKIKERPEYGPRD